MARRSGCGRWKRRAAVEDAVRTASGQARIAGGGYKKMVSPQLRRQAVV